MRPLAAARDRNAEVVVARRAGCRSRLEDREPELARSMTVAPTAASEQSGRRSVDGDGRVVGGGRLIDRPDGRRIGCSCGGLGRGAIAGLGLGHVGDDRPVVGAEDARGGGLDGRRVDRQVAAACSLMSSGRSK